MNIFRFAGDMTHLISVLVLLLKIYATKSCSGISLKTQELYSLVFVTRYLDLFTDFISVYNTVMKVVFIGSSLAIVWCMRWHRAVKRSYDRELDTFRHFFLVAASFVLALFVHEKFTFQEIFWAFSIYLEAVAILPQLVLLQRSGNVDNLTGQYVLFLGQWVPAAAAVGQPLSGEGSWQFGDEQGCFVAEQEDSVAVRLLWN
ncbi:ER lumen protein-retaining receptor A-like isoform X2 [Diospyros lotus]|uniref:ER lumen protein-retaining receptor A-like isoform X2 n=1 Tax=Diospyros lotus TaxID=55363 RepID=UPI0022578120|nr:ER lumen protein-retaining receptor A-like isoform X2 [Diospyros lotus]